MSNPASIPTAPAIRYEHTGLRVASGRAILSGIDLEIEAGATTAILGRSGSGKTTLLRMANGMILPTEGRVLVEGKPTSEWDRLALRRRTGYVIQETALFPHFTIGRNMGIVLELEHRARTEIDKRVKELSALVGLEYESFHSRRPNQLSGGQRQRAGLARALAADPAVLLMDEPFGALDPISRAEMQDMLLALLARLHKTVLLITHDLDEALFLATRVVLLEEGSIAANLTPDQFLHSSIPAVERYVHAVRRTPEL